MSDDVVSPPLAEQRVGALLEAIAARTPVPGGGAVAGLVAGVAAALGEMVLAFSRGRKSLAAHAELHERLAAQLAAARTRALELADADAAAYAELNALWRLPEDDPARRARWDEAVDGAIAAPLALLELAAALVDAADQLVGRSNRQLDSDLAIAALLGHAAAEAAAWNVRINLPLLADDARRERLAARVAAGLERTAAQRELVAKACAGG